MAGRENRPALRAQSAHPVDFADERHAAEEPSVRPIEDVVDAVAIRLQQQLARLSVERRVEQDRHLERVPVVHIVRRVLEMPFHLAGVDVERDDAVGVEVVALAVVADEIGRRLSGAPVDQVELRDRSCRSPRWGRRRSATSRRPMFRCRARPASESRSRSISTAPVSASNASMKPPPWPLPLMMIRPLAANGIGPWNRLPGCDGRASHMRIAGAAIERDERGILRDHVDHVAVDADAALPSDARRLPEIFPDQAAGRGVERVHAVVLADIHHAFIDNRRRLEIFRTGQVKHPLRLQPADVLGCVICFSSECRCES